MLRRFNEKGIVHFDQFRESAARDTAQLYELLEDPTCSSAVAPSIEVEQRPFPTRFAVGEYLHSVLGGASLPGLDTDRGLWSWLAAFYFGQLCPQGRNPGARHRWIPESGYNVYYRHLLRGPYQIYRAHSDNPRRALAVLATAPSAPGDIAEQLVARQDLITNPNVIEVATLLYINPATDQPKRGAARRDNGGARCLPIVLDQLDLIWDLYRLEPDKLLDLLPEEFDQFKP